MAKVKAQRNKLAALRERTERTLLLNYDGATVMIKGKGVVMLKGKVKNTRWWREKVDKASGQVKKGVVG